ncbi:MAG: hypothetical protein H6713_35695 [Myxococcales bacterium]|nr:hypothetical protein [Myxococcales bacterium]
MRPPTRAPQEDLDCILNPSCHDSPTVVEHPERPQKPALSDIRDPLRAARTRALACGAGRAPEGACVVYQLVLLGESGAVERVWTLTADAPEGVLRCAEEALREIRLPRFRARSLGLQVKLRW